MARRFAGSCVGTAPLAVLLFGMVSGAGEPLRQHPDNPRYLLFRGRPEYLLTSGEHYGAVLNADFDYVRYLDTLQKAGFNYTRIFTGAAYVEPAGAFNIEGNTLAPAPGRFLAPWKRSSEPGYAGGGPKFDLDRWEDAYFQRLRGFLEAASQRAIIVEVTLFCPSYREDDWTLNPLHSSNHIQRLQAVERTDVFTLDRHGGRLAYQEKFARKLVEELAPFDNLFFEICNEPYFGGVTLQWQHHIADVLAKAMEGHPPRKLIAQNIANQTQRVPMPHPEVAILNFHYAAPPVAVSDNQPTGRVIGDDETGFRGIENPPYRMEAWDFLVAGGGLMNHLDYSFSVGHEDGSYAYPSSQPGGGNATLREQLGILDRWFEGFDFLRMDAAAQLLSGKLPDGVSARVLAEPGEQYAVYIRTAQLPMQYSARWSGTLRAPQPGRYQLVTRSNDGVRLWLDDQLLIDNWSEHPTAEDTAAVDLTGQAQPLRIEYFYAGGQATMQLFWAKEGDPIELVPSSALRTPTGQPGMAVEKFADMSLSARVQTGIDPQINVTSPASGEGAVRFADGELGLTIELPAGRYTATWQDTKTGQVLRETIVDHAGRQRSFAAPPFADDIALAIRRADRGK